MDFPGTHKTVTFRPTIHFTSQCAMRCGLGTANKHPNSKCPGQDLMSEIGSYPVWKVIIIVIMINN